MARGQQARRMRLVKRREDGYDLRFKGAQSLESTGRHRAAVAVPGVRNDEGDDVSVQQHGLSLCQHLVDAGGKD